MPRLQERTGCYVRPFAVVSTALWDKYDGHRYVTSVEPLSCEIDAQGRLRRRRLLTMEGKLPLPMRPLLGSHPLYLLEEIVVDRKVRCVAAVRTGPRAEGTASACGALVCLRFDACVATPKVPPEQTVGGVMRLVAG